jgi:hypothetical protein
MSLRVKYHNATEFSLYRFLIPEVCAHQGRAIHLDPDMVCLDECAATQEKKPCFNLWVSAGKPATT